VTLEDYVFDVTFQIEEATDVVETYTDAMSGEVTVTNRVDASEMGALNLHPLEGIYQELVETVELYLLLVVFFVEVLFVLLVASDMLLSLVADRPEALKVVVHIADVPAFREVGSDCGAVLNTSGSAFNHFNIFGQTGPVFGDLAGLDEDLDQAVGGVVGV